MKCELCHNKEARRAVTLERDGKEEELYVCEDCAGETSKAQDSGVSDGEGEEQVPAIVSVTKISGDMKPPPIVEAIIGAFDNAISMLGKSRNGGKPQRQKTFPTADIPQEFVLREMFHLEGLYLGGQSLCMIRAAKALGLALEPCKLNPSFDCHRLMTLKYTGSPEKARKFAKELLVREQWERRHIMEDCPIVLVDAASRALGVLQNCRLLAASEIVDFVAPLRLALAGGLLTGIGMEQLEKLAEDVDLSPYGRDMSDMDIDCLEAGQARAMSALFKKVSLSAAGKKIR